MNSFSPITLLKFSEGSPFPVKLPLMEVWNGWEFLTSTVTMGPFRLIIFWLPFFIWDHCGTTTYHNLVIQHGGSYESVTVLWSSAVPARPALSPGVRKISAPLRAASVMITFEARICRACVVPILAATPSAIGGSICGMMTGIVHLINNFVGEFRW